MNTRVHDPASAGGWHLDRRIPVALIVSILVGVIGQTIGVVMWGTGVNYRVNQLELGATTRTEALATVVTAQALLVERLVKQETETDGLKDSTKRIENKVDQLVNKLIYEPERR